MQDDLILTLKTPQINPTQRPHLLPHVRWPRWCTCHVLFGIMSLYTPLQYVVYMQINICMHVYIYINVPSKEISYIDIWLDNNHPGGFECRIIYIYTVLYTLTFHTCGFTHKWPLDSWPGQGDSTSTCGSKKATPQTEGAFANFAPNGWENS